MPSKNVTIGRFNPTDPQPLYIKIKQYILERIKSSEWPPDFKIPSEAQLVNELGASRMTVNRAIKELVTEGLLVRLSGVGTFVVKPKPRFAFFEIKNIVDEIKDWGGIHESVIHILQEEPANADVARSMEIPIGSNVYHSMISHYDGSSPVQLSDRFVNPTLAPDYLNQDFTKITPYQYLLNHVVLTEVDQYLEAILPDQITQDLLKVEGQEPCLSLRRRTFCLKRVSTSSQFIYPGSRFTLGERFNTSSH